MARRVSVLARSEPFGNDTAIGGFYCSVHIRTNDASKVRSALEALAAASSGKFLMAPVIDGWISVYPEDCGQELTLGAELVAKMSEPILNCLVHDDAFFTYQYFNGGELFDSYSSCPDYFGGDDLDRGGSLDGFEVILPHTARIDLVKALLAVERFTVESERFWKFANLLGLPNAVTSYAYLQRGERDGIRLWNQFIHIPDLT